MPGFLGSSAHPAGMVESDQRRAGVLRRFAAGRGWFVSRSTKKWGAALAILRRQLGERADRIDEILDWYVAAYGRVAGLPKIRNGRELIQCWEWLTDAADRDGRKNPAVVVGPAAEQITRRLSQSGFARPRLAEAVQLSLENARLMTTVLLGRAPKPGAGDAFASRLLYTHGLARTESFVERWYKQNRWIKGDLVPRHVLSADNPEFVKWVRAEAAKWGDAKAWDRIMGAVKDAR